MTLIALAALALAGCGTASRSGGLPSDGLAGPGAAPRQEAPAGAGNALSARMPALATFTPGTEFDYVLSARFADELFQGSGRIAYDSAVVRPVEVLRGEMLPPSDIFVARLDAPPVPLAGGGLSNIVPFAFTGLPGSAGSGKCDGELLRVRFRVITAAGEGIAVRLINEPEYLQMRGLQGQRLGFDLNTEEVTQ
jgi:hypothetical protein